ncbi:MAG: GntR family transcriptional regulator [Acidobacteria bacterium]|nr:MAG: GntR family transcriptional regulator [Acidobacteriota bacterium]
MVIDINPSSGVPVFRQIMDQVHLLIAGGLLKAGDPLPPTRSLATELGINPMTVSKAYGLLERDGILIRRPGKPSIVRTMPKSKMVETRTEILTARLSEAVRSVAQLGIDQEEAVSLFDQLLSISSKEPAP